MEKIICVVGPTASGKTGLSIRLAQALGGEVLSCDSMQIYQGMDIGTAKVTPAEMQGVRHHMLDLIQPSEDYSVSRFVTEAEPILQDILRRGKYAILTGGTGLYIDSLARSWRRWRPGKASALSLQCWSDSTPNPPSGCTRRTRNASSALRRSIWRRARPSQTTTPAPGRCPPGTKRSGWAWILKTGRTSTPGSTSGPPADME